ncbi:MAG: hypothetical protein AAB215_07895 [Planctomycetota bacterium]
MRKTLAALVVGSFLMTGCISQWGVETNKNSEPEKILNFTTGDGTYENYSAVGRYNRSGLGLGLGIFTALLYDISKIEPSELVTLVSKDAAAGGANAVINAQIMPKRFYGFIIGFYSTSVEGTGIKTPK